MNADTHSREAIEISKLVAEVRNLVANTLKMEDEREKLRAEARKMQGEAKWHPLVVGAGIFSAGAVFLGAAVGAVLALVKMFL